LNACRGEALYKIQNVGITNAHLVYEASEEPGQDRKLVYKIVSYLGPKQDPTGIGHIVLDEYLMEIVDTYGDVKERYVKR